jgi:hypothetical protein
MKTIIAVCCMILIGSVAAHPEESPLKRFRVAQSRTQQCLWQCDSIITQCKEQCGEGNNDCTNRCNTNYRACRRGCQ